MTTAYEKEKAEWVREAALWKLVAEGWKAVAESRQRDLVAITEPRLGAAVLLENTDGLEF